MVEAEAVTVSRALVVLAAIALMFPVRTLVVGLVLSLLYLWVGESPIRSRLGLAVLAKWLARAGMVRLVLLPSFSWLTP